jgi:hypothetical protein
MDNYGTTISGYHEEGGAAIGVQVGDVVTIPKYDMRNWWQRHAPNFLGGRTFTPGYQKAIVTSVSSSNFTMAVHPKIELLPTTIKLDP